MLGIITLPTRLSADPITSNESGLRSAGLPGIERASRSFPALPLGSPTGDTEKRQAIPMIMLIRTFLNLLIIRVQKDVHMVLTNQIMLS